MERTAPRITGLYAIGRGFVRVGVDRNQRSVELAYVLAATANVGRSQNGVLSLRVLLVKKNLCMLII